MAGGFVPFTRSVNAAFKVSLGHKKTPLGKASGKILFLHALLVCAS